MLTRYWIMARSWIYLTSLVLILIILGLLSSCGSKDPVDQKLVQIFKIGKEYAGDIHTQLSTAGIADDVILKALHLAIDLGKTFNIHPKTVMNVLAAGSNGCYGKGGTREAGLIGATRTLAINVYMLNKGLITSENLMAGFSAGGENGLANATMMMQSIAGQISNYKEGTYLNGKGMAKGLGKLSEDHKYTGELDQQVIELILQKQFSLDDLIKISSEKKKGCKWGCTESLEANWEKIAADSFSLLGLYGTALLVDKSFNDKYKDSFDGKSANEALATFLFNVGGAELPLAKAMASMAHVYLENQQDIDASVKSWEISSKDLDGHADSIAMTYKILGPVAVNR